MALVRALSTEPQILHFDEPFSALDSDAKKQCYDELLRLQKRWKISIIMVTHDIREAKMLGNRILYIKKGQIFQTEVIKKCSVV